MPGKSQSTPGTAALNFARSSAITSSVVPLAVGLELDQEIAGVRLGDRQRQPRAGAARVALDLGGGAQDFFGLQQLAVGFGEARADGVW